MKMPKSNIAYPRDMTTWHCPSRNYQIYINIIGIILPHQQSLWVLRNTVSHPFFAGTCCSDVQRSSLQDSRLVWWWKQVDRKWRWPPLQWVGIAGDLLARRMWQPPRCNSCTCDGLGYRDVCYKCYFISKRPSSLSVFCASSSFLLRAVEAPTIDEFFDIIIFITLFWKQISNK